MGAAGAAIHKTPATPAESARFSLYANQHCDAESTAAHQFPRSMASDAVCCIHITRVLVDFLPLRVRVQPHCITQGSEVSNGVAQSIGRLGISHLIDRVLNFAHPGGTLVRAVLIVGKYFHELIDPTRGGLQLVPITTISFEM